MENTITVTCKLTVPDGQEAPPASDIALQLECMGVNTVRNPETGEESYRLSDPFVYGEVTPLESVGEVIAMLQEVAAESGPQQSPAADDAEETLAGTPWDTWRTEVAAELDITPQEVSRMDGAYESFNTLVTPKDFADDYRRGARGE